MRFRAITESNSVYEIDPVNKTWCKNGGPKKALHELRSGSRSSIVPVLEWPLATQPRVGENMFIMDEVEAIWVVTTPVVSVEEISDLEDTIRGGIE